MTRVATQSRSFGAHPLLLVVHGLILIVGFAAIATSPIQSGSQSLLGTPSAYNVRASSRVTFVDRVATNRQRLLAAEKVSPVFSPTVRRATQSEARARALFTSVLQVLGSSGQSVPTKHRGVQQLLVADSVPLEGLPKLSLKQWRMVKRWSLRLLSSSIYEQRPFDNAGIPSMLRVIDDELPDHGTPTFTAVTDVVRTFITPTHRVNNTATHRLRRQAAAKEPLVVEALPAGTVVVRKGEVITPGILQELKAVGLPTGALDWRERAATVLFGAVIVILMVWYLAWLHPEVTSNQMLMALLDVTVLVSLLASKVVVPNHNFIPYFLPVAGASALAALLVSSEVGVALSVAMAILVGWIVGHQFELTVFYLTTGVAGALAVRRLKRLNDFILAGALIAVTAAAIIAAFHVVPSTPSFSALRDYAAAAGFNGLVSGALAFGGYVLLGNTFGITTSLHLLELGHPDQKLLRRLMSEAPGTYNHSLVVASMVERAAGDIEADVLLGRVMALYHDIGKVANPLCFIENQLGTSNIHDDLTPRESAEIIRAHVTHGLVLAKQHRLPGPMQDAIMQHHGTMAMTFFFHRALQEDPDADAATFTYPGPRPRTKEAALLMLADGCEGAVRAAAQKSAQTIREIVDRIVDERLSSSQLNQCNLTLRDIASIRGAFVEVLNGIYHPRIEYPDPRPSLQSPEVGI